MQHLTLIVAACASVLICCTSPITGLAVYVASFTWYPMYMTVSVGTIDFNANRIAILALWGSLLCRTKLAKGFKFIWPDKLLILYFCGQIAAGLSTTQSPTDFLVNRAGAVFEIVLPYFALRVVLDSKDSYIRLLKSVLWVAAPVALMGFYESLTAYNPMHALKRYCPWRSETSMNMPNPRSGFYRAFNSFGHPIMFGMFFAILGPICTGVIKSTKRNGKVWSRIGIALMALGVFSSMSSGPFMAALFALVFILLYHFRGHLKAMLVIVILLCMLVEVTSNRHFYEVVDRFTFNSATAWYRSRLIEVALFEGGMSGHWIAGFGQNADPGWGLRIDHRSHTDMVNHYLLVLSRYGLVGFVPFLALIVSVSKELIKAYKSAVGKSEQWLVWCMAAGLFGVLAGMNSVSLNGPPRTVFFMVLASAATMPTVMRQPLQTAVRRRNGEFCP